MPSLRVLNISFDITLPYVAGHSLTASEAAALNKLRTSHVAERAKRAIARARKTHAQDPTADELSALALAFAFDDPAYVPPSDPLLHEIDRIARSLVREALTKRGETEAQIGPQEFARLVAEVGSKDPVRAEANRRVLATQRVATAALLSTEGTGGIL